MDKTKKERFVTILKEGSSFGIGRTLLVDRETGVTYLVVRQSYGVGVTPLSDRNGQLVITSVDGSQI